MKYCKYCGKEINASAVVCPYCGCQIEEMQPAESGGMGIAAIIFGALGGWLGLLFGIIGLSTYKTEKNRKNCKIGIGLFIGWIILWIIIFANTQVIKYPRYNRFIWLDGKIIRLARSEIYCRMLSLTCAQAQCHAPKTDSILREAANGIEQEPKVRMVLSSNPEKISARQTNNQK